MHIKIISQMYSGFKGFGFRPLSNVARKYAEMHGGRVWAESEGKGKGSTFFVELPVK